MPTQNAKAALDRYFLEMRSKVIDLAAALGRIECAPGAEQVAADPRLQRLRKAIAMLTDTEPERTARVQMVFADPYDPDWPRPHGPRLQTWGTQA